MPLTTVHVFETTLMGANLVGGGATFRVWAPNALAVHVVGNLAGTEEWRPIDANALTRGPKGHWVGFLPGVKDGDVYRFYVKGSGTQGYKRDPYARELT